MILNSYERYLKPFFSFALYLLPLGNYVILKAFTIIAMQMIFNYIFLLSLMKLQNDLLF